MKSLFIALVIFAVAAYASAVPHEPRQAGQTNCNPAFFSIVASSISATRTSITLSIETATAFQVSGGSIPSNAAYPAATGLPVVCVLRVSVVDTSQTPTSDYRFGLLLPPKNLTNNVPNWNNRILTVGGASFAGGINWPSMSEVIHYGFATLGTDNGFDSSQPDMSWASVEKNRLDWGYRAMHGSVGLGKFFTNRYYNVTSARSYYSGCSTGGRQGLREIQQDATSFDGALIGAPAYDTFNFMPWITKLARDLIVAGGGFTQGRLNRLAGEVLRQCSSTADPYPLNDGIISDPDACLSELNFSSLNCSVQTTIDCIPHEQLVVINEFFYRDYRTTSLGFVQHGFDPGSELFWSTYWVNDSRLTDFDGQYERTFMGNSTFNVREYGDYVVNSSRTLMPGRAAAPPSNLSAFKNRNGRIMLYHGMADGLIQRKSSRRFYEETRRLTSGGNETDMRTWFRYFEVPGMDHCWGSTLANAPWHFGGSGQALHARSLGFGRGWSVPGHENDPKWDALAALVRWVEGNSTSAPNNVTATAFQNAGRPMRTRPICAFPQVSFTEATGNQLNTESFYQCVCRPNEPTCID